MKSWTPDASEHFESWLGRVRHTVAGDPSIDPDDVAQDLRAHVHAELEAMPEPVTIGALDRVLSGLGNPSHWTDGVKPPRSHAKTAWFRRSVTDSVTGWQKALAGEWGMPVLLAALTLTAIPTFADGGWVLLVFAYVIARANVVHAPHQLAGRSRWLIYLPLAIGAGVVAGMVLAFPVMLGLSRHPFQMIFTLGMWWIILGFVAAREPKRIQSALRPFADDFDVSHARFLAVLGAALLISSTVILLGRQQGF